MRNRGRLLWDFCGIRADGRVDEQAIGLPVQAHRQCQLCTPAIEPADTQVLSILNLVRPPVSENTCTCQCYATAAQPVAAAGPGLIRRQKRLARPILARWTW